MSEAALGLLLAAAILLGSVASAGDEPKLAITIGKALPRCGQPVSVGVRYTGPAPSSPMTVALSNDGTSLAEVQCVAQEDGSLWGGTNWTPGQDGFQRLVAVAGDLRAERTVPVVQRDMHFVWWGIGPDLKYITATTPAPTTPEGMQYCRDNGIQVLAWKGATSKTMEALAADWADPGDADGIAIDELGAYEHVPEQEAQMAIACEALGKAKAANPESFLAVWNAGSLTVQRANAYRDHADLVMLECYLNFARNAFGATDFQEYLDQRLKMACRMDLLRKCVIGLGITEHLGGITPGELRTEIEHIRLTAPDSPGLAWFTYGADETV
ncbi:MAG: hypothetical protein HPY69_18640, partial [Armatimonadetes bacterium]|nr:hypothetical protein [Armatimonadota bacterium]